MDVLRIGVVLKPQGVHGQLKVEPLTDDAARFAELKQVYIEQEGLTQREVMGVSLREGGVYLQLKGCDDRDTAERLRGAFLCVPREAAVKLPEGRYFIVDLVGCDVTDTCGRALGKLTDVLQYGAADIYVISGERCLRVPALKTLLHEVDVANKRIVLAADILPQVAVWDE